MFAFSVRTHSAGGDTRARLKSLPTSGNVSPGRLLCNGSTVVLLGQPCAFESPGPVVRV